MAFFVLRNNIAGVLRKTLILKSESSIRASSAFLSQRSVYSIKAEKPGKRYGIVYTDGCCRDNGRDSARAGIGVYWGPGDERNLSMRLSGKQTNNRAEINAAYQAILQAKASGITNLVIITDSMYVVNCMTDYIHAWKKNNWKLSSGKPVSNITDIRKLHKECKDIEIIWKHVKGHSANKGNEMADFLANDGATKT